VVGWAPGDPGKAKAELGKSKFHLANRAIDLSLDLATDAMRVSSGWTKSNLRINRPFALSFEGGNTLWQAADFKSPEVTPLKSSTGEGLAETFHVRRASGAAQDFDLRWTIELLNGKHYLRETLSVQAIGEDIPISRIFFGEGSGDAPTVGKVEGSPIVAGNFFVGLEHPMSHSEVKSDSSWDVSIARKIPLKAGQSITYSAVIGATPRGQMRRAFLAYLEDQRARRYEPFLHYNSWYDLGEFGRYTAKQCVERINRFGDELATKRGVKLRSFLFDDGWDNPKTLWKFNPDFPDGFTPLKDAAESHGAGPGVWLSPWGGYADPRAQRLAAGKAAGMEIDSEGYALSGPKYYALFHQVCMDFVQKYGINQFKFDGTGSPDKQYPGSAFASDFEAAIQLIHDLREAKPGLFINLTTGTWPSPFWTRYADSIWRGGEDHSFDGVGTWRQKWITYRDGDTYHEVVSAHSMYPLNSLMLHGLIFAHYANHLNTDPGGDFRSEVRTYFGNGTQLQEMYITPDLLSKENWDDIAESANWSYANRDVLVDSHWIGGDPSSLSVYGWASWSPRKGILVLRNPSDKPQAFSVDIDKDFELPPSAHGTWQAKSPYSDSSDALSIPRGSSKVVLLKPFQVMVLEGPVR
jgi:hypothetical protein